MKYRAELIGSSLFVWDFKSANAIYWNGYYGRPLWVQKPKGEFSSPLVLDIIEGAYLVEKGNLYVSKNGTWLSTSELLDLGRSVHERFDDLYAAYKRLREMGFVVLPGIKFGADFAVYRKGPGIEHAPYIVKVFRPNSEVSATDVVLTGRLGRSVKKKFVYAIVKDSENVDFVGFDWWKP